MKSFSQVIFKVGVNPCVVPPEDVLEHIFRQSKKKTGAIPVRGTINGTQYQQTLVKFDGYWRLYINGGMLKASGLKNNDVASITIEFDPSDRTVQPHPAFLKAIGRDPRAVTALDALVPSHRKEINRYLNNLKSDKTRMKNMQIIIDFLTGKKVDRLHAVLRIPRPKKKVVPQS